MNTSIRSPYLEDYLAYHEFQDRSNDCGPYSASLVIRALTGAPLAAESLAREMDRPIWRFPLPVFRRIPKGATFPWGLTDVLRRYGLAARWQLCASCMQLQEGLARGEALILVLAEWKTFWLHIMTLSAFDAKYGWGFVNTAFPQHTLFWMRDEKFRSLWRSAGRLLITARIK